jgi:hypothetical protein
VPPLFCAEKKRLLIDQVKDEWFAFGPPAFQAEIPKKMMRRRTAVSRLVDPFWVA